MVEGIHWYKRDPDAALNGMRELSLEQRGAYNTILDLIYARAGDVQDDEKWVAGCLGCDVRVWRRLRSQLIKLGKIFVHDGVIKNDRAEQELGAIFGKSEKARGAALKRHGRRTTSGLLPANLGRTSAGSSGNPNDSQPPISKPQTIKTNGLADAVAEQTHMQSEISELRDSKDQGTDFDFFWSLYPKQVAKRAAEVAFEAALQRGDKIDILMGVRAYRAKRKGQDEKYTKHPAAWLNGDCWKDGGTTAPQPAPDALPKEDDFLAAVFGGDATDTLLYKTGRIRWPLSRLGPPPEDPACKIDPVILSRHGYRDPALWERYWAKHSF